MTYSINERKKPTRLPTYWTVVLYYLSPGELSWSYQLRPIEPDLTPTSRADESVTAATGPVSTRKIMATSYAAPTGQERQTPFQGSSVPSKAQYVQDPIAVVGLACRLPGDNNTPTALWDFLERGGCAAVRPPDSRFRLQGHYDASKKPKTMASPGGMFLESIDPQDVDAPFFKLSKVEAISMDPQQRQLLEVVYEGLENAGISLEALAGQAFGCFVGSYASGTGLPGSTHFSLLAKNPSQIIPMSSHEIPRIVPPPVRSGSVVPCSVIELVIFSTSRVQGMMVAIVCSPRRRANGHPTV